MSKIILGVFTLLFFHYCKTLIAEENVGKKGKFALLRVETDLIESQPSQKEVEEQSFPLFLSLEKQGEIVFFSFLKDKWDFSFLNMHKNTDEKNTPPLSLTPEMVWKFSKFLCRKYRIPHPVGFWGKIFDWKILLSPKELKNSYAEKLLLAKIGNKLLEEGTLKIFPVLLSKMKHFMSIWEYFRKSSREYYDLIVNKFSDYCLSMFLPSRNESVKEYRNYVSRILNDPAIFIPFSEGIKLNMLLNQVEESIEWLEFFKKTVSLSFHAMIIDDTDYNQLVNNFFNSQRFFRNFEAVKNFFVERRRKRDPGFNSMVSWDSFLFYLVDVRNDVMREIDYLLNKVDIEVSYLSEELKVIKR